MNVVIITGSAGLIGSEAVAFFADKFDAVIGIDNNLRAHFFGQSASVQWNIDRLKEIPKYQHHEVDIRDYQKLEKIFATYSSDIKLVVHAAAQPSHDWAANDPLMDFSVNATGTANMLELTRKHASESVFIFTSTNKVYGDTPNFLPLVELDSRWEVDESHPYFENGINEQMSIDQTKHSLFGASKVSADVMVQEYGRYFGMKTGVFRGGCLTGPNHSGTQLHGFLSYLMKCAISKKHYTIFGYNGKQVRDNIHSFDLINMFWHFYQNPTSGEVYNAGGGRTSNCSMIEAIGMCEEITGEKMNFTLSPDNRSGDHIWWISDLTKFKTQYPEWELTYGITGILQEIYERFHQDQLSS
jgi:CDP-paratose 2-epimerase